MKETLEARVSVHTATVTECNFLCLTRSEAKQTETSEFGAEKGLLLGCARRQVDRAPKAPNSSKGFSKALLKAR